MYLNQILLTSFLQLSSLSSYLSALTSIQQKLICVWHCSLSWSTAVNKACHNLEISVHSHSYLLCFQTSISSLDLFYIVLLPKMSSISQLIQDPPALRINGGGYGWREGEIRWSRNLWDRSMWIRSRGHQFVHGEEGTATQWWDPASHLWVQFCVCITASQVCLTNL